MIEILILGGTEDSLALHRLLAAEAGFTPRLCLAGRTVSPRNLPPHTRIGGFGGADGLAKYMDAEGIDVLVDATHPFAAQISRNAVDAASQMGTPRLALIRPPWPAQPGDAWQNVGDETQAAAVLPKGGRVFLALGAQKLEAFSRRADVSFAVRVVDPPRHPLLPFPHDIIVGRGPYNAGAEAKLLAGHGITHLVMRNSGGSGAVAKLEAARRLGLQVIVIARPAPPPGPWVATAHAGRDWIMERFS